MAQQTVIHEGAFTNDSRTKINANFTDLYGTAIGGTLTSGHVLVGNSSNVATDTAITGDLSISNTGVTTLTSSLGQVATVSLTAANIIALHSLPFVIVAAPGSGKAVIFESLVWEFTYGSAQMTGGGAVTLVYDTGATNIMSSAITQASIQAAANSLYHFGTAQTANGIVPIANKALTLSAASADFAAGDSTAKAFVKYRIVTL